MVRAKAKKAAAPPKKMGRPPVTDAKRRDVLVRVLVAEGEHAELQRAAADATLTVSSWMRMVALERAREIASEKAKKNAQ